MPNRESRSTPGAMLSSAVEVRIGSCKISNVVNYDVAVIDEPKCFDARCEAGGGCKCSRKEKLGVGRKVVLADIKANSVGPVLHDIAAAGGQPRREQDNGFA